MKKALVAATVTTMLLGGVAFAQQQAAPVAPSPIKRNVVGKIEVPGANYEVVTALVEIAPGFKAGRHFHPGIVQAQVTEGEFWLAIDGQPEKTFKAGENLELPNKVVHNEGAVGSGPVKLVAVYVVEKGQPLVTAVKD